MSKSKPRKYFINEKQAIELFSSFGFRVRVMNWYQLRISPEESNDYWDWYHTQGSTVVTRNSQPRKFGEYGDIEKLAEAIKKDIYKLN